MFLSALDGTANLEVLSTAKRMSGFTDVCSSQSGLFARWSRVFCMSELVAQPSRKLAWTISWPRPCCMTGQIQEVMCVPWIEAQVFVADGAIKA